MRALAPESQICISATAATVEGAQDEQMAWKSQPRNCGRPLHSLCSYMAMFPPPLAHHFILKYSQPGDSILDPFSGRGTVPLEACFEGRIGIGNDKNPLAYVLTKAKVGVPSLGRIISRITQLEDQYEEGSLNFRDTPEKVRMLYHPYTLKQLLYLRSELDWRTSNVDAFITGMVLGSLHGKWENYLSIPMPNTFSMAPNYVAGYIAAHELKRPKRNAFEVVRNKLEKCHQVPISRGKVFFSDARRLRFIRDESIDLIVTSPPYTRVIRYGKFNWIRLWFLGYDPREVDKSLFCTSSPSLYEEFMRSVLIEQKRVLRNGCRMVLVLGDVDEKNGTSMNLADMVLNHCALPLGFRLDSPVTVDMITSHSKVSRIWGDKRGHATQRERFLVLRKEE